MLAAFLWPFAIVVGWGLIFGFAIFITRIGAREHDEEMQQQAEQQARVATDSGWTHLLS
ncbi:MAG TPA: hypothetical protein VIC27_05405 [Ktedonobacterales bacterium]